jgi:hypothetical protein
MNLTNKKTKILRILLGVNNFDDFELDFLIFSYESYP